MTNEEAINILKSKMDGSVDTSYEWAETVRLAIKALETQPDGDAISRQAAISSITNQKGLVDKSVAKRILAQLPPAQPEIIRCKDCKYCDRGIDEDGNPFLKCLGWVYGGTQEEDFCSHAERRTDEQID